MNLTARIFLLSIPLFGCLLSCKQTDNTSVLAKHEAAYPEIRKKYVYQSVIRLANIKRDPDFEKLIQDVEKIVLYMPPREDSTYQIKDLRSGMRSGGYEELMDVRTADADRVSLWVMDKGVHPHYLALVDAADQDYILEVDGYLHLEYINSINMADETMLTNLLKGGF